ncbi:MAG: hypothetical protein OEZ04_11535, partial [Nitrospinota bacterium]|nr:hypothetical protein [Nitrospinota bacterium]
MVTFRSLTTIFLTVIFCSSGPVALASVKQDKAAESIQKAVTKYALTEEKSKEIVAAVEKLIKERDADFNADTLEEVKAFIASELKNYHFDKKAFIPVVRFTIGSYSSYLEWKKSFGPKEEKKRFNAMIEPVKADIVLPFTIGGATATTPVKDRHYATDIMNKLDDPKGAIINKIPDNKKDPKTGNGLRTDVLAILQKEVDTLSVNKAKETVVEEKIKDILKEKVTLETVTTAKYFSRSFFIHHGAVSLNPYRMEKKVDKDDDGKVTNTYYNLLPESPSTNYFIEAFFRQRQAWRPCKLNCVTAHNSLIFAKEDNEHDDRPKETRGDR